MSFKCCQAVTAHEHPGLHRKNVQALNIQAAELASQQLQSS